MIPFKPQKAKTYGKDKIKDLSGAWRLSKKYDGHQIFIVKQGSSVEFFTSQWKQFNIEVIREPISKLNEDFVLIGEFLWDSDGKLGSRSKSAKLTTFRTNFKKGLENLKEDEEKVKVMVFDCILRNVDGILLFKHPYFSRYQQMEQIPLPKYLEVVESILVGTTTPLHSLSFRGALATVDLWVSQGWEGGMLIRPDSTYHKGKRVHHAVKLKGRHTADLLCVGVEEGEGKYEGLIGSLELQDSQGRTVFVGSGLNDAQRAFDDDYFIGRVIEIEYERIDDTYIQPVFKCVRNDKTIEEID